MCPLVLVLIINVMSKTLKAILEIVKLVITAILGYFGGNAIM